MSDRKLSRFRMIEYGDSVTISDYSGIIEDFDMGPRTDDAAFVLQAMNELHERREAERRYAAENWPPFNEIAAIAYECDRFAKTAKPGEKLKIQLPDGFRVEKPDAP